MPQIIVKYPSIDFLFPNIKDQKIENCFYNISLKNPEKKKQFIERSLSILLKTNQYLLNNKDAFFLVDPRAYNDQCHLYSLLAAKIQRAYPNLTAEQRTEKTLENRFLHICHAYTDNVAHGLSSSMLLEHSPLQVLTARGLV